MDFVIAEFKASATENTEELTVVVVEDVHTSEFYLSLPNGVTQYARSKDLKDVLKTAADIIGQQLSTGGYRL